MPGGPPTSPLSSATEVRDRLRELYPEVERGAGSVATLLGAAETGKSRLVADIAKEVRERGWSVLMATGSPRSSEVPRGIVLDAMRPILPGVSPARGMPMSKPPAPMGLGLPLALAAFLPQGASEERNQMPADAVSHAAPWELPSSLPPAEADALLSRRLWESARKGPVLLLLDDVQWMDELSQRFLSQLCLAAPNHRVLIVLALDPETAPPLVRRFATREEGGLSNRVHRLTLATSHRPRPMPPSPPPAPETVEPSLLETLLGLGAAAGIEFDLPTLVEATGRSAPLVLENLEEAARRGWVWKSGEESFHFSGERAWRWAMGLPYEPLRARHERIARALEKLHPKPEGRVLFELAHQWEEAGDAARAFPFLVRSAEAAYGVGALAVARDRIQRSLGILPSLPENARGPAEVRVLVDLAEVMDAMGEGTKAAARLREALARAQVLKLPARETVRVEVLLGDLHRRWGRGDHALEIFERARALAATESDRATEAAVLSRIAMVQRRQGHWADARESVARSLALLDQGSGGAEERALVHFAAADTYIWGGKEDDEAAELHIRKTREALRELHQVSREVPLTNLEGLHASQLGDTARSLQLWKQAAETAMELGNLLEAANMHANLAEVYAETRRFSEAQSSIALANDLIEEMDEPRVRGQIHLSAATLAWRQGDRALAERELDQGVKVLDSDASVDLRQQLEFLRARIRISEGKRTEALLLVKDLDPLRYPHLLPPNQRQEWDRMHEGP